MNQHDSERLAQRATQTQVSRLRARAAYSTPRLSELGDIRDLTLGTSAGSSDSGGKGRVPIPGVPAVPGAPKFRP